MATTPAASPRPRPRVPVLFGRALLARCPRCGARGLFARWFRMHPACRGCGLVLERGEDDYWLGAQMFNLVVSELLFVAAMTVLIVVRWPDVPWTFLQYGGVALMVLAPFALYPLSKTIWLAWDLAFRHTADAPPAHGRH